MEMENKEQQEIADPRRNRYIVYTKRDAAAMRTFVKFTNRVRHPRVGMNMFIVGAMLVALPIINKGIGQAGAIISYVMGFLLVFIALFRTSISVSMMKKSPEAQENEELIYLFGNTGIRVEKNGTVENMGYYKDVYGVWEDERHFYVGLESEDLLILPKSHFEEGDVKEFRDFILDKSGAVFKWQPTEPVNILKNTWLNLQMKMAEVGQDNQNDK